VTEEKASTETELAKVKKAWKKVQEQLDGLTEEQIQLQQQIAEFEETISRLQQQIEEERQLAKQQLIDTAKRVVHELPTSIIPLMDQIAVVPLIGPIDATRTECIIEAVSSRINSFQPKVVFLDITGVPEMNDEVTAHLDEITQAVQSQGVQATLIGLPED